ncbi:carboxypeptidase-like regulatory domain-containing protein [Flammeovirga yaeyamensis]|uniref:Carboxypeptidase-like regulatory domain-containing protein n=1 Tax=Flammeovirga yaeyamensis TaxID=367791 RepID=A0AAX1N2Y9_9BACT|nr:carboxypeptidase-like regulatory domain-containing protein [Flammeovirga yaeyamensis]MBB3696043.1 thiol-disulfide isomerase/thioredoxin [Flammeovirga yaeyamensis]NMF34729.1 hypothetical protein [Flammeovirga yaeyamensis]QWG00442.1 carboxypeptidase-like regulatory domain-containing protein [Flammeovirga yaeyamensis]
MKSIYLFLLGLITCTLLSAQDLKGKLIDKVDNTPIPYANVLIKGKYIGAATNDKGYFRIPIKTESLKDTLEVSCIGYEKKRIPIAKLSLMMVNDIALQSNATELDLVVVKSKIPTVKEIIQNTAKKFKKEFRQTPYLGEFYYAELKYQNDEFISGLEGSGDIYFNEFDQKTYNITAYKGGVYNLLFDQLRENKNHDWNYDETWDFSNLNEKEKRQLEKGGNIKETEDFYRNSNLIQSKLLLGYSWNIIKNGPLFNYNSFEYTLEDLYSQKGSSIYVLSYKSVNPKIQGTGKLYIRENYEVVKIESNDFFIPISKNDFYYIYPYISNRKNSKGNIQFAYRDDRNYIQDIDYQLVYNDPKTKTTYEGHLDIVNFSTTEGYSLNAGNTFRLSDKVALWVDMESPFAEYNGAYWEFRSIDSNKYSELINQKEISYTSLYDKRDSIRVEYNNYFKSRTEEQRQNVAMSDFMKYKQTRELLKRSTYSQQNHKDIKNELKEIRTTYFDPYYFDKQREEISDSLNYHYTFMKQIDESTNILNNLAYHTDYKASNQLLQAVFNNMSDTLFAYKDKLNEDFINENKGNIIALWIEANTIYAENFTDTVKVNNRNHLISVLKHFDLNDPMIYSSPVLAEYIAESIHTQITIVEDDFTSIEKGRFNHQANTNLERFQEINQNVIQNEELQEKVLFEYLSKYHYYNDTLSNAKFNQSVEVFKNTYPTSSQIKELTGLANRRKGFKEIEFPKDISVIDTHGNEFSKRFDDGTYVINLFVSWCGFCKKGLHEDFPAIIEKHKNSNIKFVYLFCDQSDIKWKEEVNKLPITEQVQYYRVTDHNISQLRNTLNVQGYPTQFIVKDGVIIKRITGLKPLILEKELNNLVH